MGAVHGRSTSWQSIEIRLDGTVLSGYVSVDFGEDKLTEELGYGNSGTPQRRSQGRYEPSMIKLSSFASDAQELLAVLAAASSNGRNYTQKEFTLTVAYARSDFDPVQIDVAERCRVLSVSKSYTEGPELLLTDLSIQPMNVIWNGLEGHDSALTPGI